MHKKNHHKHHSKHKKRRLGLFYGAIASVVIIALIAIFYFAVLVSTKPRSILLVTQKIESALQEKFGPDNVSIDDSHITFTKHGKLKISINGLRILYPRLDKTGKESFIIPNLDTEFSLFGFLLMRFQPSKIKISNPNIFLGDLKNNQQTDSSSDNQLSEITSFFSSIRSGKNPIENFEIENAKLVINNDKSRREILLRKSQIHIENDRGGLKIISQNQLSLDNNKNDINLDANCLLGDDVNCNLSLENFIPNSIADLNTNFHDLSKIHSELDATVSFVFHDDQFENIKFNILANKGDFEFSDFFAKKMYFNDFSLSGSYDHKTKKLDLTKISTDFISDKKSEHQSHLEMSLQISELENKERKFLFDMSLNNVLVDELEKFWPITLSDNGIRAWVSDHTENGVIEKASAKFSLTQKNNLFSLDKVNADLNISDLTLKYDSSFPEIKNIKATAKFDEKSMQINIAEGNVLQSKISDGLVVIDDFTAKKVMLKITGKSNGHAANGLQHASNNQDFSNQVAKYLNGDSQNSFDIRIPLSDNEISLKNCYIEVNSEFLTLNNEYLRGKMSVSSKKDFKTVDFVTKANLSETEFDAHPFSMNKKSGVPSNLELVVSIPNSNSVKINNILLTKKENKKPLEKFSGNVSFATAPFMLTSANLKNNNFSGANYSFNYQANNNSQKIIINGDRINLGPLLSHDSSNGNSTPNLTVQISANKVFLLRDKSLRNFNLSLQCLNGLCSQGNLKANYGKQQSTNLKIEKGTEANLISGEIEDIGYIAEGFGISNVINGGNAKVKIEHYALENKPVFRGDLTIDNDITIFENETVKRFNKDTLFSQIRDKIFSSEKTTFNSVKVNFEIKNSVIDIRSLIANNYKIGITSKGQINLLTKDTHLKGMIIPGYIVNSLFGIGNIPVVGGVISGLLTGGEGGGLFGIRYQYDKNSNDKEGNFTTNKVTAFVPSTIQNLFE